MPIAVPRLASEEYSETRMLRLGMSAPIHRPAKNRAASRNGKLEVGASAEAAMPTQMRARHMRMCLRRPILSASGEMTMAPSPIPNVPALRK